MSLYPGQGLGGPPGFRMPTHIGMPPQTTGWGGPRGGVTNQTVPYGRSMMQRRIGQFRQQQGAPRQQMMGQRPGVLSRIQQQAQQQGQMMRQRPGMTGQFQQQAQRQAQQRTRANPMQAQPGGGQWAAVRRYMQQGQRPQWGGGRPQVHQNPMQQKTMPYGRRMFGHQMVY